MVEVYKTSINGFEYDYFTTGFFRDTDPISLDISPKIGIRSSKAIYECHRKFQEFKKVHSRANVEDFFGIKFCHVRVRNGKILRFEEKPLIGDHVVYFHIT